MVNCSIRRFQQLKENAYYRIMISAQFFVNDLQLNLTTDHSDIGRSEVLQQELDMGN